MSPLSLHQQVHSWNGNLLVSWVTMTDEQCYVLTVMDRPLLLSAKPKRQYLLTCKLSRCCLLVLRLSFSIFWVLPLVSLYITRHVEFFFGRLTNRHRAFIVGLLEVRGAWQAAHCTMPTSTLSYQFMRLAYENRGYCVIMNTRVHFLRAWIVNAGYFKMRCYFVFF